MRTAHSVCIHRVDDGDARVREAVQRVKDGNSMLLVVAESQSLDRSRSGEHQFDEGNRKPLDPSPRAQHGDETC